MPKQIKTKKLSPRELTNAKLALTAMAGAFLFGATFTALLAVLGKDNPDGSGSSPLAAAVSCCFLLYLVLMIVHCVHGVITFEKQEDYGILLTAVMSGFSAFTAILNVQFAAALFLTAVGLNDAAKKVVGGVSFDDFMAGQRTSWILMIFGIGCATIVGMTGLIKLGKNAGKR